MTTTLMMLIIIETVSGIVPARAGTTMDVGSDVRIAHEPTHNTMYVNMHIGWIYNLAFNNVIITIHNTGEEVLLPLGPRSMLYRKQ